VQTNVYIISVVKPVGEQPSGKRKRKRKEKGNKRLDIRGTNCGVCPKVN
jgi:hypothetical protein